MSKKRPTRRSDGAATERKIFDTATRLFRERGFDATTMRDVAAESGLSLGAAYHYFPSKDAIVLRFYERIDDRAAANVRAAEDASGGASTARDRVLALYHAKLDAIGRDRKLMTAVFRAVGDPESPVSIFSGRTAHLRRRALDEFRAAIQGEPFSDDVRALLPGLLWVVHMATLLYFLYDRSPGQRRTRRLVDGTVDLILGLARMASLPGLEPMRKQMLSLAREIGVAIGEE